MPTKKLKARAEIYVPASKDQCAADIRQLGDLQRRQARLAGEMNDKIAAITAAFQPQIEALQPDIDRLFSGVQTWCEANRAQLTDNHKVKSANLITGEVTWRIAPPSCSVRGAEAVIKALKTLELQRYVRTKEEVDKEAVLATYSAGRQITDEDAAKDAAKAAVQAEYRRLQAVTGITVVSGVESFVVTPFEQEVA